MSLGPVMIDLKGLEIAAEEREMLCHPLCGGVILFSRNYRDPRQVQALVAALHGLRRPRLLVAVDHEGGAVQRFREGFTQLPAAALFGHLYDRDHRQALRLSEDCGWLMATELRAVGVDFSFAPVLDIGTGLSRVINDRAFHRDPRAISRLAQAFVRGMHAAGMAAVGKHFPGHGSVAGDSHHEIPEDGRDEQDIRGRDLLPFAHLIGNGLAGVMPAHVIYPRVDPRPAGFSRYWLQQVLRADLGFEGVIFSDDLSMAGAAVAGDMLARARAAMSAGCDMVLACNDPHGAGRILEGLEQRPDPVVVARLARMHGRHGVNHEKLRHDRRWREIRKALRAWVSNPELDLGDDELL